MGIIDYDADRPLPLWAEEISNRHRLRDWLEAKFPDPPGLRCPGCGKDEWIIGPLLALTTVPVGQDPMLHLALTCRHCACLQHLSAQEIGIEQ